MAKLENGKNYVFLMKKKSLVGLAPYSAFTHYLNTYKSVRLSTLCI